MWPTLQHEIKRLPPEQHVKIKVRHELITIKLLIFVVSWTIQLPNAS